MDKIKKMYPKPSPENMTHSMLINDISKMFANRMRRETESIGMSHGYRRIFFHLAHSDGLNQNSIVKLTHLTAPTVSVALQKMEDDGLVERKQSDSDMRQTIVRLTQKGRDIDDFIIRKSMETENVMLENISEEELEYTRKVLIKIMNNLIEEMDK